MLFPVRYKFPDYSQVVLLFISIPILDKFQKLQRISQLKTNSFAHGIRKAVIDTDGQRMSYSLPGYTY